MIQSLLEQRWIEVDGGTWSKNMEANEVVGNSVLAPACHNVFKSTLCVFYVY